MENTKNTLYRDLSLMLVFLAGLYLGQFVGIANTYLERDAAMQGLKTSAGFHFLPAVGNTNKGG